MEETLRSPEGILVQPDDPTCAVLVLSGSSGRVEADRVRLLASQGAAALSYRWFGDGDLPPGICEIPLESFTPYVDRLAAISDNLAIIGTSKGAEAALLLAAHDPRVRTVVAIAPTHVVWSNVGPGYDGETQPWRSCWTVDGKPLPFVPFDTSWSAPDEEPVVLEPGYAQSLRVGADQVPEATIPVERIAGKVILVAGGDDQVWNSADHASRIASRRTEHGLDTTVVTHPSAGHRTVLPGEHPITGGSLAHGGTPEANAALGALAWPHISTAFALRAD
jgi:dienelactone hydrolase